MSTAPYGGLISALPQIVSSQITEALLSCCISSVVRALFQIANSSISPLKALESGALMLLDVGLTCGTAAHELLPSRTPFK